MIIPSRENVKTNSIFLTKLSFFQRFVHENAKKFHTVKREICNEVITGNEGSLSCRIVQ